MNSEKLFANEAMVPGNPNWEKAISRRDPLYNRSDDIRSPFSRDYTRILHSLAYRRLKHKTQVFYGAAGNDHVCTRIEHVSHVESVSNTIAKALGLNEELTRAIAMGHDLGHAPFGHRGETILSKLTKRYLKVPFWHEQNGVYFVDNIELLEDPAKIRRNLNLTYAVRDGIISHCGEVDQNALRPRDFSIDLSEIKQGGALQAATWEGCVVKLSDKIAYLGRDIEDAERLGYFGKKQLKLLRELAEKCNHDAVNTTVITHSMILDICQNSQPDKGICMSPEMDDIMCAIKQFNYKYIYGNPRLSYYVQYAELVLNSLFNKLSKYYRHNNTFQQLCEDDFHHYNFVRDFALFLADYCDESIIPPQLRSLTGIAAENIKIYSFLDTKEIYYRAIIDFLAGMTDNYAVSAFEELLKC